MSDPQNTRGYIASISKVSGVPYETVRRYYAGSNVGFESVDRIRKAERQLPEINLDGRCVPIDFTQNEIELLMDALWAYKNPLAKYFGDVQRSQIRQLLEKICVAKHYAEKAVKL